MNLTENLLGVHDHLAMLHSLYAAQSDACDHAADCAAIREALIALGVDAGRIAQVEPVLRCDNGGIPPADYPTLMPPVVFRGVELPQSFS